ATIQADVVINDDCWIGPNAEIWNGARLGKGARVYPGASVSSIPQALKFPREQTQTYLCADTVIPDYFTVSSCSRDTYKHVIGDNCILVNAVQLAGHVEVDDWAIIGGASALHQFVKIGAHVMISGGSLVRKDVPPYVKAAREPLAYAGINSVGLRRRGFTSEKISEIQEIYRYIFMKGMNNSKALEELERKMPETEERDSIINFIRNSERGIMKGYGASD